MFGRDSPVRPSIREQIAAKRAEFQNSPIGKRQAAASAAASASASAASGYSSPAPRRTGNASTFAVPGGSELADKTKEGEIKRSIRSGKLDLCSLSLDIIPPEVYTTLLGIPSEELSSPPIKSIPSSDIPKGSLIDPNVTPPRGLGKDEEKELVFGSKVKRKEEWIEPEELTAFRIAENNLRSIEREIGMFGGLERLDLSRNQLKELPDSVADLLKLTSLDLSSNSFTSLPRPVLVLPSLQVLDISNNAIHNISFSDPIGPSEDGLSYGIGFFTTSFERQAQLKALKPIFPVLRSFNISHNKLTVPGLIELSKPKNTNGNVIKLEAMLVLNLENNNLQGTLDYKEIGLTPDKMPFLTSLILSRNTNLRGTNGSLAKTAKIELSGCNLRQGTPQPESQTTTTEENQSIPQDDDASTAVNTSSPKESTKSIPNPNLTLVYRTLPAATFDSEPLPIDFDIYLPPNSTPSKAGHPLVIWFHGGGLLQGNKENLPPHFRRLPSHPFIDSKGEEENVIVISPNYRLAPQTPILDILDDVTHLITYIKTKLNDRLKKEDKDYSIDVNRICLSGGSAGGYLALIAGLNVPANLNEEDIGGYRGLKDKNGITCLAPFYPITDLTDKFWATETDPVPWMGTSVPHSDAKPHLNPKSPPICSTPSGGPRSILYPYMLQHGLFPGLLFQSQKSVGYGLDAFRPSPLSLSVPHRLDLANQKNLKQPPIYFLYGTIDDKVQPMQSTLQSLEKSDCHLTVKKVEGGDHAFDEDPEVECEDFKAWLGETLI
ncbi:uncharacterized protein IL334_000898 [Kwoniella shivajii]|uniref:BD-FAE-like domain-containing protein n=1 Tax=Kwoniella shivajii TaxID=564305 RepID=A0ABZ1CQG5_9TREE|nr:hypothetical protein IL334_000898 [Kwoniella shivajii]